MKKIVSFAFCALMFSACQKDKVTTASSTPAVESNWSSSAKFGSWTEGAYYLSNDVWGGGAGTQSIWANSHSNWGIWSQQSGGGIKSYAHVGKPINKTIDSFSSIKSSWAVTNPNIGAYDTSYDIWLNNNHFEIMLWTFEVGNIKPIADHYNANGAVPYYTNLNVGGHTWNVYAGPHGTGRTFSFVRTSTTNSGTVDLLAIFNWIESISASNSAFAGFNNPTLQDVQFGWEITNTNGVGTSFNCTNFNVTEY